MRTGLGINRQAAITRFEDLLQRIVATKVHDVDGRVSHFRQRDGASRGFGFGSRRTRERVVLGCGLPFGQSLLHDDINGSAVFRVHADHRTGFG